MRRGDCDPAGGFALVEAIAVLAISALVLVALLIATDLVSRNAAAAARRANDLETLTTGLAALRRDLEGTLHVQASGAAAALIFFGEPDALGIAVESDRSGRDNGQSLLHIETRYKDGQGALIRSSAPLLPETGGFTGVTFGDSALLALGPWRYRFSYAGPSAGRFTWRVDWPESGILPVAVRLEVLDGEGERVIPALTVRLPVDTSGCAGQSPKDCGNEEEAEPSASGGVNDTGR